MIAASLLLVVLSAAPAARPAASVANLPPPDLGVGRLSMVTGCVASDRGNAYQLTNVILPSTTPHSAFRLGPRPVGATVDTDAGRMISYALDTPFKLKSQVGQKVEIIGTVEGASSASRAAATLKVRSVRMLNERCN